MEYTVDGDKCIIRLDLDEDLFSNILKVADTESWPAAYLSGIGALKESELGFYDFSKKEYKRATFNGIAELINLNGNLTFKDGARFLHLHAALGTPDFNCFGGHLFGAKVGVTCEIFAMVINTNITREENEKIGLADMCFGWRAPRMV